MVQGYVSAIRSEFEIMEKVFIEVRCACYDVLNHLPGVSGTIIIVVIFFFFWSTEISGHFSPSKGLCEQQKHSRVPQNTGLSTSGSCLQLIEMEGKFDDGKCDSIKTFALYTPRKYDPCFWGATVLERKSLRSDSSICFDDLILCHMP